MRSISRAATFMRPCSASAPSIAAKVWPQQVWFLNVMRQMLKVLPSGRKALLPVRPVDIARPKPASPSITSSDPVTPSRRRERGGDARLGGAARVQRLGHRIHAEGLLQAGGEGRDRRQRVREALRVQLQQLAAAAQAPNTPMVPVLCQYL